MSQQAKEFWAILTEKIAKSEPIRSPGFAVTKERISDAAKYSSVDGFDAQLAEKGKVVIGDRRFADFLGKALFAYIAFQTVPESPTVRWHCAVDSRLHGAGTADKIASDADSCLYDRNNPSSVLLIECKTKIGVGNSYQIKTNKDRLDKCDAYFAVLWWSDAKGKEVTSFETLLTYIRTMVLLDTKEIKEGKHATKESICLCPAKMATTGLTQTKRQGKHYVITHLRVAAMVPATDGEAVSAQNITQFSSDIQSWARSRTSSSIPAASSSDAGAGADAASVHRLGTGSRAEDGIDNAHDDDDDDDNIDDDNIDDDE